MRIQLSFSGEDRGTAAISGCPESETATADRGGRVFLLRAICLIQANCPLVLKKWRK